jgi:hypothetical protein
MLNTTRGHGGQSAEPAHVFIGSLWCGMQNPNRTGSSFRTVHIASVTLWLPRSNSDAAAARPARNPADACCSILPPAGAQDSAGRQ